MKKLWLLTGLMATSGLALADETGRVLSSTPLVQQVPVTRQVCNMQPVAVAPARSGAGALMGALAGGALGNAVGGGGGRAAATVLGVFGGAMLGDQIEGGGVAQVQNVQQCSNQTAYENRTVAWNVVYEYGGQQYTAQMPSDPGPTVRLQVTPVGGSPVQAGTAMASPPDGTPLEYAPVEYAPPVYAPQVYAPAMVSTPVYTQPMLAPAPYIVRPYFPPVGLSLNFGYSGGYGGHRGHWR